MSDHAHEDYVTRLMRHWLASHHTAVQALLATIERENTDAGNWDEDNGGRQVLNEDIEWLAGELEQFAIRVLDTHCGNEITLAYTRDCISEVDWPDIAMDYVQALVRKTEVSG